MKIALLIAGLCQCGVLERRHNPGDFCALVHVKGLTSRIRQLPAICLAKPTPAFLWGSYSAYHFNIEKERCEEVYVARGKGCAPFFTMEACTQRCERTKKKPKKKPYTPSD
ncbi:hypothetical protein DSO57_1018324 [Entomophthora muscae]|uniref:Uncharacterized protein n=1 Tax=Entomophthora muscae TaxID=34485 RepID=A0ACC2S6M8_9FUNG|nr:hypothetical protein DSO57_1018324 [Entomophthora muscae]